MSPFKRAELFFESYGSFAAQTINIRDAKQLSQAYYSNKLHSGVSRGDVLPRRRNGGSIALSWTGLQECVLVGSPKTLKTGKVWITNQKETINYPWCPIVANDDTFGNENCAKKT